LAAPTHIAFGRHRDLYAANIGTGSITRTNLRSGVTTTVASGLGFTPGVAVGEEGRVVFTASQGDIEAGASAAGVFTVRGTKTRQVADTLAWEVAHNPDGQQLAGDSTSNPYSVLALDDRTIVADAGANDLLVVGRNGVRRTLTVFPVIHDGPDCSVRPENGGIGTGCDATPTDVEMGPDGYLYVSGLSGGAAGQGRIYKVNPRSGAIVRTWDGLPPLTGIAVAHDGTIYAVAPDLAALNGAPVPDTSAVLRIKHGSVTRAFVPVPTDVEISRGMVAVASFAGLVFSVDRSAFH
jgi:sugar lactone lactonase YvrE